MINNITQTVLNMDYSWRDPKTYAILVPLLSPLIYIIQTTDLKPKLVLERYKYDNKIIKDLTNNPSFIDTLDFSNDEKYAKAFKYNWLVVTIRLIASLILLSIPLTSATPISFVLLQLILSLSNIADILTLCGRRAHVLSLVKEEGLPTKVCFDMWGPTTPIFFLQDFLRSQEAHEPYELFIYGHSRFKTT